MQSYINMIPKGRETRCMSRRRRRSCCNCICNEDDASTFESKNNASSPMAGHYHHKRFLSLTRKRPCKYSHCSAPENIRHRRHSSRLITNRPHKHTAASYSYSYSSIPIPIPILSCFVIIILLSSSTTIIPVTAQDSNHFFCGTSWDDASGNCDERQHCAGGTDDECETDGHICFGGTTCDIKLGHGNKFKFANLLYGDISNTRFCGDGWQGAIDSCR